jgi:hypothetical protein
MAERLAFLLDGVPEAERMARCRELRALSLVYLGLDHPVTIALAAAVTDPAATDRALTVLDAFPALRRRRLLASYGALMARPTLAHRRRRQQISVQLGGVGDACTQRRAL